MGVVLANTRQTRILHSHAPRALTEQLVTRFHHRPLHNEAPLQEPRQGMCQSRLALLIAVRGF